MEMFSAVILWCSVVSCKPVRRPRTIIRSYVSQEVLEYHVQERSKIRAAVQAMPLPHILLHKRSSTSDYRSIRFKNVEDVRLFRALVHERYEEHKEEMDRMESSYSHYQIKNKKRLERSKRREALRDNLPGTVVSRLDPE